MKINQQYQQKHVLNPTDTDWVLVQKIERDICLLYHQLSEYSYIMEDLYYGDVYGLPYWEYLNLKNIEEDKRRFIREGCLVFIYAMISEVVSGSGTYLTINKERYLNCKKGVDSIGIENEKEELIITLIKKGFELIDQNSYNSSILDEKSTEIHKIFVREYFNKISNDFKSNKYFHR